MALLFPKQCNLLITQSDIQPPNPHEVLLQMLPIRTSNYKETPLPAAHSQFFNPVLCYASLFISPHKFMISKDQAQFHSALPFLHRIPGWCWLEGSLRLICHGQGWHWEMRLIRAPSNPSPHPKGCSWFLQDTQRKGFHWATAVPQQHWHVSPKKSQNVLSWKGHTRIKPRGKDCDPSRAALRYCWKRIGAFRA